jgi:hypothetical protein
MQLWLCSLAAARPYLDGAEFISARPLVTPGDHVLALRVSEIKMSDGILMAAFCFDLAQCPSAKIVPASGNESGVLTLADGTWKYSTAEPDHESWMRPGYDDTAWRPMVGREFPKPAKDNWSATQRMSKITERGGEGLGIDRPPEVVLIRKTFHLLIE